MTNLDSAKVMWELKEFIASAVLGDEDLRNKLIENPNETIESILPGIADQGLSFKIVEERDNELIIALPPALPQGDEESEEELSEEQLAGVSGGVAFIIAKAAVISAIVTGAKAAAVGVVSGAAGYAGYQASKAIHNEIKKG